MIDLYKTLMTAREDDSKRLWTLFGLMNLINGALLAYVVGKDIESKSLLAFLGLIISSLWLGATRRMSAWIQHWEAKLQELEPYTFKGIQEAHPGSIPPDFKVFVDRKLNRYVGLSTKWISQVVPGVFIFAWSILLAGQIIRICFECLRQLLRL